MSDHESRQLGAFLRHEAGELTRMWRVARQGERPGVTPGLADALLERFLEQAGTLLEQGGAPEQAIQRTGGVLRWIPGTSAGELRAEWALAGQVLATACEPRLVQSAGAWIGRATEAAADACVATDGGRGPVPQRMVVVLAFPPARRR